MRKNKLWLKVVLAAAAVSCVLAGCGKEQEPTEDTTVVSTESVSQEANTSQETDAGRQESTSAEDGKEEASGQKLSSAEMYQDFVSGKTTMFHPDWNMELDLTCLAQEYCNNISVEWEEQYTVSQVAYTIMDCGKDGEPELALEITLAEGEDGWFGDWIQYVILKNKNGVLEPVMESYSQYRTYTNLCNPYGYYSVGGSFSASSYGFSYYYVTADGEDTFLYSMEEELGIEYPVIPEQYLPDACIGELAYYEPQTPAFEGEGGSVCVYSLTLPDYEDYDAYLYQQYFVFYDEEGNCILPEEAYIQTAKDLGICICTEDDVAEKILDVQQKNGMTQEMNNWEELQWSIATLVE